MVDLREKAKQTATGTPERTSKVRGWAGPGNGSWLRAGPIMRSNAQVLDLTDHRSLSFGLIELWRSGWFTDVGEKYSGIEFLQTPGRTPDSGAPLGSTPGPTLATIPSSGRNGNLPIRESFHISEYGREGSNLNYVTMTVDEQNQLPEPGHRKRGWYQNRPLEKAKGMAVSMWPDISHLSISKPELINVLRQMGQHVKWPHKTKAPDSFRNLGLWYDFHRDHSHKTEGYVALKIKVNELLKRGDLRDFLSEKAMSHLNKEAPGKPSEAVPASSPRQD
ncbi:hypothetical protein F2Q69_00023729 [Brassica cretica]|uniref:Uncharacterized protein n=1 Tax=Brassica cretica TaxID=69181 RepID=A0A8S9QNH9_BRACR|nr:hypothetical protein F2Q69_00023729 [Brassica cretica]